MKRGKLKYLAFLILPVIFLILEKSEYQPKDLNMNTSMIHTSIGEIAYYSKEVKGSIPILFLHGVYYDHNLWNYHISRIDHHTTIAIDMPLHGQSKKIKKRWNMDDCSQMFIDILDALNIEQCYAIGHSWGSMTLLRAASKHPDRFIRIGLCNMPVEKGSIGAKTKFWLQHLVLGFREFYYKQVAKAMFSEESIKGRPEVVEYLEIAMSQLSNRNIRQTDKAVITNVDSGLPFLKQLSIPVIALKGKDDYVPILDHIETTIVKGKHTSPLEQPEQVMEFIERVVND